MIFTNPITVANHLKSLGHKNVELTGQGVRLSCCLGTHVDSSPSAFVVMTQDKSFYKCFSCGERLPLSVFFKLMEIEGDAIHEITEEIPRIHTDAKDLHTLAVEYESGTLQEGMEVYEDSMSYLLYPKVRSYLANRVCEDYYIPKGMNIRFNQDRLSLLLKGVEKGVTERFAEVTGKRFKNYGNSCLFHHYTEEVEDIVLVEGFFDYLTVVNAGFNGVALMTASMTPAKYRQLENIVKNRVYLMLDNDLAGATGTVKITEELTKRAIPFECVDYEGKDPSDIGMQRVEEHLVHAGARRLLKRPKRADDTRCEETANP